MLTVFLRAHTGIVSFGRKFSFVCSILFVNSLAVIANETEVKSGAEQSNPSSVVFNIEADAARRIDETETQYALLKPSDKPEGYAHCRWVDLKALKKEMPFYVSEYEGAIQGCQAQWAPHTETLWTGLNEAKSSSDPNDYKTVIEFLRGSRYQESAENSAVRELTDKVIELFEGGASKETMVKESYLACAKWAELDPDQILSGREYKPLSVGELAVAKGFLACY